MALDRQTVDLSAYPDLVMILLGMRVNRIAGLKTLLGFGPRISTAVDAKPDGLLLHEPLVYSLFPLHVGMRQYWRDFDALERWSRSGVHREWWQRYLRDTGGTGFWHETYFVRGGVESVFIDWRVPTGLFAFAPHQPARGPLFSARDRLRIGGDYTADVAIAERELGA